MLVGKSVTTYLLRNLTCDVELQTTKRLSSRKFLFVIIEQNALNYWASFAKGDLLIAIG
jgi:hypothetical protein